MSPEPIDTIRMQIARQVAHWVMAAQRLGSLDDLASPSAWEGLERYVGVVLRQNLLTAVNQLHQQAKFLQAQWNVAETIEDFKRVQHQLVRFRKRYLRTEVLLDFYADAINTRTNPTISALLRACDSLCQQSMTPLLQPFGKSTPPVLTYLDQGLGASILKAGLRLWDGKTESAVAAIKIVRHNLYRPTALIHESGHQIAHILGWNQELAAILERELSTHSSELAEIWASWSSEIAADAIAFVHTGYAAVATLHDVLAGGDSFVFNFIPGDPHPTSYIRVLLGVEMCRQFFGTGSWDELSDSWSRSHLLERANSTVRAVLQESLPLLPKVSKLVLSTPMRAFGGRKLVNLVDPQNVRPSTLLKLEYQLGSALYTSHHWVEAEAVRLLALSGYKAATLPEQSLEILQQQRDWMVRLGSSLQAA
ncbi:hypothetical protein [Coleofasciculus sp. F4-SAH-05]|uniref:hypothetical protein n=1 Tax=Coleofasciculus sp. F4-SAH-05 TaxID=3069525 RepID=UPI0032FAC3F6